jgi:hypothetical protein
VYVLGDKNVEDFDTSKQLKTKGDLLWSKDIESIATNAGTRDKYIQKRISIIIITIIYLAGFLSLVTSSVPIKSLEVFKGVVLGFVSHMVDNSSLRKAVCLCPFAEHVVLFCIFFKTGLILNIFTGVVILPCVFCRPHKLHFR